MSLGIDGEGRRADDAANQLSNGLQVRQGGRVSNIHYIRCLWSVRRLRLPVPDDNCRRPTHPSLAVIQHARRPLHLRLVRLGAAALLDGRGLAIDGVHRGERVLRRVLRGRREVRAGGHADVQARSGAGQGERQAMAVAGAGPLRRAPTGLGQDAFLAIRVLGRDGRGRRGRRVARGRDGLQEMALDGALDAVSAGTGAIALASQQI